MAKQPKKHKRVDNQHISNSNGTFKTSTPSSKASYKPSKPIKRATPLAAKATKGINSKAASIPQIKYNPNLKDAQRAKPKKK
jgi:hypothetical protein